MAINQWITARREEASHILIDALRKHGRIHNGIRNILAEQNSNIDNSSIVHELTHQLTPKSKNTAAASVTDAGPETDNFISPLATASLLNVPKLDLKLIGLVKDGCGEHGEKCQFVCQTCGKRPNTTCLSDTDEISVLSATTNDNSENIIGQLVSNKLVLTEREVDNENEPESDNFFILKNVDILYETREEHYEENESTSKRSVNCVSIDCSDPLSIEKEDVTTPEESPDEDKMTGVPSFGLETAQIDNYNTPGDPSSPVVQTTSHPPRESIFSPRENAVVNDTSTAAADASIQGTPAKPSNAERRQSLGFTMVPESEWSRQFPDRQSTTTKLKKYFKFRNKFK